MAIYAHRDTVHQKVKNPKKKYLAEFSLLYKAAFLKGLKLFSTREACETRILRLIKLWKRKFKFKCLSCEELFEESSELSNHDARWCQMSRVSQNGEQDQSTSQSRVIFLLFS